MNDEIEKSVAATHRGSLSRRNALKAGAAVGVGAAVWSGVSITSLGGTPAYAAGCTGVLNIPLDTGCRNTSDDCNPYAWHPLKTTITVPGFPAGSFFITNNVTENECCSTNHVFTLNVPSNLQCNVFVDFFHDNGSCPNGTIQSHNSMTAGVQDGPTIAITMSCLPGSTPSTHYDIFALCNSIGAPSACITTAT